MEPYKPINVGKWGASDTQLPYCAKCDYTPDRETVERGKATHCEKCGKLLLQPCRVMNVKPS